MEEIGCANCSKIISFSRENDVGDKIKLIFHKVTNVNSDTDQPIALCNDCDSIFNRVFNSRLIFSRRTSANSEIRQLIQRKGNQLRKPSVVEKETNEDSDFEIETIELSSDEEIETILPFIDENNTVAPGTTIFGNSSKTTPAIEFEEKFLQIKIPKLTPTSLPAISNLTYDLTKPCCEICDRYFQSEQSLANHIESVHQRRQSVQCRFCSKRFFHSWFLQNHVDVCHSVIKIIYSCLLCDQRFETQNELDEHKLKSHKCPFKCSYCEDVTFESIKEIKLLREHLIEFHGDTEEGKAAAYNKNVDRSKNTDRPCTDCEKLIARGLTTLHILFDHHNMKTCQDCNEEFSSLEDMKKHIVESNHHLRCCDICKQRLNHMQALVRHMEALHKSNAHYPFKCESCLKPFRSFQYLHKHYVRHVATAGAPKNACQLCNKSYIMKHTLKKHIGLAHSQDLNIKCHICSKGFKFQSDLNGHLRKIHKSISWSNVVHKCSLCEYTCGSATGMSMHRRIHVEKKKIKKVKERNVFENQYVQQVEPKNKEGFVSFQCTKCNEIFSRKDHITGHLYQEHGIQLPNFKRKNAKEYECGKCEKVFFTHKTQFDKHMAEHYKNDRLQQFYCDICDDKCKGIDALRSHFKTKHPASSEAKRAVKNERRCEEDAKTDEKQPSCSQTDIFCTYCKIIFCTISEKNGHDKMVHKALPVCKLCQKICEDDTSYKEHEATHAEFPCQPCELTFFSMNDFHQHLEAAHLRYPYICEFCGILLSRSDTLLRHYTVKHSSKKKVKYSGRSNAYF